MNGCSLLHKSDFGFPIAVGSDLEISEKSGQNNHDVLLELTSKVGL
jgi:hypothetical protein